jgi:flavin reductase (DIM6/NTAB) family NADH-FMN oxidoreductase RutF/rubredoxin
MNIDAYFKITYGLYVVSSFYDGKLNGYISNTVFQVTAEPPQFAVACNKNNLTVEMIQKSKVFSISALHKDYKIETMSTFGYKSGRDIEKFNNLKYKIGQTGAPILIEDSIAWFECEVVQTFDVGSHLLFIGKIVDGDIIDELKEPLTYAYFRETKKGKAPKNAPTYVSTETIKSSQILERPEYYCSACGYKYNPEKGDPDSGIAPGTRFEDLPENWVCPICGAEKADFVKK